VVVAGGTVRRRLVFGGIARWLSYVDRVRGDGVVLGAPGVGENNEGRQQADARCDAYEFAHFCAICSGFTGIVAAAKGNGKSHCARPRIVLLRIHQLNGELQAQNRPRLLPKRHAVIFCSVALQ
jgi:hypothetical protein